MTRHGNSFYFEAEEEMTLMSGERIIKGVTQYVCTAVWGIKFSV